MQRVVDLRTTMVLKLSFWVGLISLGGVRFVFPAVPEGPEEVSTSLLRGNRDPNSEFMISVWQSSEGLPVNIVDNLEETPDGYLWLGTVQGLVRFDGLRFQSFFTTPSGLRYGARVGPLAVDARGRLWLAPDQVGLVRLDESGFTEVLTNGVAPRARVESLCADGTNGLVWTDAFGNMGRISTEDPVVSERMPGRARAGWVRDFEGRLWLTQSRRLRVLTNGLLRDVISSTPSAVIVAPRRAGGLWVAGQGRLRWLAADGTSQEALKFPWSATGGRATCLLEDRKGRVWIGTSTQGLFCFENGALKPVAQTTSAIVCLLEDRQDNIWAGTRGAGLLRVRERQFYLQDRRGGLRSEFVRSLCEDKARRVWIASEEGGLGWWENGAWQPLSQTDGWPAAEALSVAPAQDGGVWISTERRELWLCVGRQATRQILPPGLKEPAMDLLEDRHKRLWMISDNTGVYCLEAGKLTNYTELHGLSSRLVRRIVEDDAGDIWLGDWEGGIAQFSQNRWELVRQSSGHRDAVRSMVALNGALYIGTSAGGLLRLKNGQTSRVSVEQGLPDACIQQLLADGRGSLWGGTPHRLFRVSLQELNAAFDGKVGQVQASVYGRSEGLPELTFASWCDPRCWRTADGWLWFATANGAIHFNPASLPESASPRAIVEEVRLNGTALDRAGLQQLRPGPGRVEFRFTAPCLSSPERVRFRYQLTGVDPAWIEAGTARSVVYAGLPAGHHTFEVLACSPDGVWSTEPATVSLSVHPFFWQTPWLWAGLAACIAGGGVWAWRRGAVRRLSRRLEHLRQQHAVDQERARIAQDIHDELGANLTSIGLLADMGLRHKSNPAALTRELETISHTARASVAAMDAIVWALNPRNDSLDHFANYLAQFTRDFFLPAQVRTRLDLPANLPEHSMGADIRHQLFLMVKESYNNIARHARATEVRLQLACENGQLCMSIIDNGEGFADQTPSEGRDGLINLRERIERLGGTLRVQTRPGHGTRLDFSLPMTTLIAN